jgi:outer membrane protein
MAEAFGGIYGNLGIIYESLFTGGMLGAEDCEEIASINGFADCTELLDAFAAGGELGGAKPPGDGEAGPVVIQPKEQFFVTADVSWPLSPRVVSLARAGNQQIRAAVADTEAQRDQLLGALIESYARCFHAQEATTLIKAQAQRATTHLADTQLLFSEGMITLDALLRARAQKARSDLQNAGILQELQRARRALALLMGRAEPGFGRVEPLPKITLPDLSPDDWIDRALAGRPELAGAEARALAAAEMEIDAILQMVPAVSLSANWRWSDQASGFDSKQSSWWVGATASVPLWDGGLMIHGARQAASRKRQAKELARAARQRVQTEVLDAHSTWATAVQAIPVARIERDMYAEAHRLVEARYQSGEGLQLEVLEGISALQSAEMSLLKAEVEARLAAAALLAAGGALGEWLDELR